MTDPFKINHWTIAQSQWLKTITTNIIPTISNAPILPKWRRSLRHDVQVLDNMKSNEHMKYIAGKKRPLPSVQERTTNEKHLQLQPFICSSCGLRDKGQLVPFPSVGRPCLRVRAVLCVQSIGAIIHNAANRPLKIKSRLRGSVSLGQMSMWNNMGFLNDRT